MQTETVTRSSSFTIGNKLKDYMQLGKFTLSFMVTFSAVVSYLLVPGVLFDWSNVVLLFTGGLLVTFSANAVNQIVEKDSDAKMMRTAKRPIASGRMGIAEGWAFAILALAVGLFLLWNFFNLAAAVIALVSWFMYAYMYTPMKRVSSFSVLFGAIPGALPCLIGWTAGFLPEEDISWGGGWTLFAIQFFWQFPHFWAIAWIAHKDYIKAGFRMLPSEEGTTRYSAIQAIIYSLLLIPAGVIPYFIGMSGIVSLGIILVANLLMVFQCVRLYREMTAQAARRVMFSSYIYLPVVLLALLGDKV
ncbi:MAG TPA: heme o synthase [Chitinophagaceae bacterium]|nr:heme o synthase [Chitinophagaceae bacterium]